jgi:hypothetical protein
MHVLPETSRPWTQVEDEQLKTLVGMYAGFLDMSGFGLRYLGRPRFPVQYSKARRIGIAYLQTYQRVLLIVVSCGGENYCALKKSKKSAVVGRQTKTNGSLSLSNNMARRIGDLLQATCQDDFQSNAARDGLTNWTLPSRKMVSGPTSGPFL